MRPDLRDALLRGTLPPSGWYPVSWYTEMWRAIRSAIGSDLSAVRALGSSALRHDLNFVHRAILRALSPQTVVAFGTRLTTLYYSGIKSTFSTKPGHARGTFSNARDWDENMWAEIHGAIEAMRELAGAQTIVVSLVGGGNARDEFA